MSVDKLPITRKDIGIIYSTVAPNLEVEYIRVEINKGAPSQNIVNASYKLMAEDEKLPDIVVGQRTSSRMTILPTPTSRRPRSIWLPPKR